jgi:hypothetical protein
MHAARRKGVQVVTMTYKIVRCFADRNKHNVVLKTGLTLEQAQAHCNDPETSSTAATNRAAVRRTRDHGAWFDAYYREES